MQKNTIKIVKTINLSILDFKAVVGLDQLVDCEVYKSIHIGF